MPTERRQNQTNLAREIYEHLPRNRSYALTPEAESALGVLCAAYVEAGASLATNDDKKRFGELLQQLDDSLPGLFQQRPGDPKPLPKLWKNPLTGAPLPPPKTPDERATLAKHDPELLMLLDELEKRPYAVTQRLREAEAQRQALVSIPYGEKEHAANVFRGNNQTKQAEFLRRDPLLAKFHQQEARDVDIPIFGKNRNMTVENRLAKNPAIFAMVRIAQRIHEEWRTEDQLAAQEQRAKAEAELKRLAAVAT